MGTSIIYSPLSPPCTRVQNTCPSTLTRTHLFVSVFVYLALIYYILQPYLSHNCITPTGRTVQVLAFCLLGGLLLCKQKLNKKIFKYLDKSTIFVLFKRFYLSNGVSMCLRFGICHTVGCTSLVED